MNKDWSSRRKLAYAAALIMTITLAFVYAFRGALFPHPTCMDSIQNGFESGVDCGGECSLRCSQDVIPLSIVWTTLSKTSTTTYDLIAYVSNKNLDNAPRGIAYAFIAYDADGREISKIAGTTVVPLGDFPIIRQNVTFPTPPKNISAVISNDVKHYKVKEPPENPWIKVPEPVYEQGSIPRVYAAVVNTTRQVFRTIPVRVVLYDANGNAFAGGETIIPELGKEEIGKVVFTWKQPFEHPPIKMRVFPILDPFLGSE